MTVKVVKQFRDKYTKTLHKAGDIIEISNERYEEINSTSHGVLVREIKSDGAFDSIAFKKMNKEEIIKYAKEVKNIKLDMKMTKKEMIARLV